MIGAILSVGAARAGGIEAGAFPARSEEEEYVVQSPCPMIKGHHSTDLGLDLGVGDAVSGRRVVSAARGGVRGGVDIGSSEGTDISDISRGASDRLVVLRVVIVDAVGRIVLHQPRFNGLVGCRQACGAAILQMGRRPVDDIDCHRWHDASAAVIEEGAGLQRRGKLTEQIEGIRCRQDMYIALGVAKTEIRDSPRQQRVNGQQALGRGGILRPLRFHRTRDLQLKRASNAESHGDFLSYIHVPSLDPFMAASDILVKAGKSSHDLSPCDKQNAHAHLKRRARLFPTPLWCALSGCARAHRRTVPTVGSLPLAAA
jgi:hypothetical protein